MGRSSVPDLHFQQILCAGNLIARAAGGLFWRRSAIMISLLVLACMHVSAREKDATRYGMGLIVNVPFPERDVSRVVQEIVQNGIIRGTKEYNKDEFVAGATPVSSTRVFPEPVEAGKVFYKVRFKALDPRNFKDGSDVGTLAVRYVVQAQDDTHTVLRIDARFVEDFRHTVHLSNGSVESAEYKDIHDHLDELASMKAETDEASKQKQERSDANSNALTDAAAMPTSVASTELARSAGPDTRGAQPTSVMSAKTPEEQLHELRQQVQRLVKAPGAPLKSAPFHTASTLQLLSPGTEVLIVISTPYWYGVETHDGQHGWMLRDDLEQIP
jgi:hypothetical protein